MLVVYDSSKIFHRRERRTQRFSQRVADAPGFYWIAGFVSPVAGQRLKAAIPIAIETIGSLRFFIPILRK
jgi:hypothetical protein